jgi:hypothetical protein
VHSDIPTIKAQKYTQNSKYDDRETNIHRKNRLLEQLGMQCNKAGVGPATHIDRRLSAQSTSFEAATMQATNPPNRVTFITKNMIVARRCKEQYKQVVNLLPWHHRHLRSFA